MGPCLIFVVPHPPQQLLVSLVVPDTPSPVLEGALTVAEVKSPGLVKEVTWSAVLAAAPSRIHPPPDTHTAMELRPVVGCLCCVVGVGVLVMLLLFLWCKVVYHNISCHTDTVLQ